MAVKNYYNEMFDIIKENTRNKCKPSLLLHSCCAPCSSAVLEQLSDFFRITVYFYNPNIDSEDEFNKRLAELQRLILQMNLDIKILTDKFDYEQFYDAVRGCESLGERSERCRKCIKLRLFKTAEIAKERDFDFFTTTLSISPHKDVKMINDLGGIIESDLNVKFLPSDFKKKDGYKRSIELSNKFNLYRQSYCGCIFSKKESESKWK